MSYFFLTTTRNFSKIVQYGKILPSCFYGEQSIFGKVWNKSITDKTNSKIIFFDKYPLSINETKNEFNDYPLVIEFNESCINNSSINKLNDNIFTTSIPINLLETNNTFYFRNNEEKEIYLNKVKDECDQKFIELFNVNIYSETQNILQIDEKTLDILIPEDNIENQLANELLESRKKAADLGKEIGKKLDFNKRIHNSNIYYQLWNKNSIDIVFEKILNYLSSYLKNAFYLGDNEKKGQIIKDLWNGCIEPQNLSKKYIDELKNGLKKVRSEGLSSNDPIVQSFSIIFDTNCVFEKIVSYIQTFEIQSHSFLLSLYGVFVGLSNFDKRIENVINLKYDTLRENHKNSIKNASINEYKQKLKKAFEEDGLSCKRINEIIDSISNEKKIFDCKIKTEKNIATTTSDYTLDKKENICFKEPVQGSFDFKNENNKKNKNRKKHT